MPSSLKPPGFSPSCIVRFSRIEGNARVIEIQAFVNDENLYYDAERNLNLAILQLQESQGIDFLSINLEVDMEKYKRTRAELNN